MQIFLDSADMNAISSSLTLGVIDGITTNPTLVSQAGQDFMQVLPTICSLVAPGPVSVEVNAEDYDGMLAEAAVLRQVASNIVIKLPLTADGLRACQQLTRDNVKTNVTLCFSASQALLAMKSGATYLSPFLGRYEAAQDSNGGDPAQLLAEIVAIKRNYNFPTKILAASIRTADQFVLAATLGADCATVGPNQLRQFLDHPLTEAGLQLFRKAIHEAASKTTDHDRASG